MSTKGLAPRADGMCAATAKAHGGRCKNRAMPGLAVCRFHGGFTANARAKSACAEAESAIRRSRFMSSDIASCEQPMDALAALAGEVLAWRDVMRDQLNTLAELSVTDAVGVQRAAAVVELYERSLDRAERTLVNIGRLRLDERLVRLSEAQAELVVKALRAALSERALGLDEHAQEVALLSAGRHLRALRSA